MLRSAGERHAAALQKKGGKHASLCEREGVACCAPTKTQEARP